MKPMNYLALLYTILQNFPSIVLDSRELSVPAGGVNSRKQEYKTVSGDFDVNVKAINSTTKEKKYKVIIFITDL